MGWAVHESGITGPKMLGWTTGPMDDSTNKPQGGPGALRAELAGQLQAARCRQKPLVEVLARWPRHAADEGIRAIGETLNVLTGTVRPTAVSLDRQEVDELLVRCESFLRSDLPYRWPDPRARLVLAVSAALAGIVAVLVVLGILLSSDLLVQVAGAVFPVGLLLIGATLLRPDRSRYGYRAHVYLNDPHWPYRPEQLGSPDAG